VVRAMAEKLASSRIDRILGLIDDALDDGPCWRCQTRSGTQQSGLCDSCRDELRAEKAPGPGGTATVHRCSCGQGLLSYPSEQPPTISGIAVCRCGEPLDRWPVSVRLPIPAGADGITVDVTAYGALGDGVADDTDFLNRAIAAANGAAGRFDEWAADLAEVFAEVGDEIAHVAHEWSATISRTWVNGVLVEARPAEPADDPPVRGRPRRKPPRTCPRHGVVMAGGLCRRCAR
jgi:hypothetical protein